MHPPPGSDATAPSPAPRGPGTRGAAHAPAVPILGASAHPSSRTSPLQGMPMRSTVEVGDYYEIAGQPMRVVEVQRTTDGNGTVFFQSAPVIAVVHRAEEVPLVVSGDEFFACYLLKDAAGGELYAVGVYHPSVGERIQPATPRRAPFTEVIVMCWQPGPVRVLIDGQPAADETVSIVVERATEDGMSLLLLPDKYKVLTWSEEWGALVDSGQRDGSYKTDANGYVYNAALGEELMFPRGDGAWGQRLEDRLYDGAPAPTEYAQRVWLYLRGQRAELREGQPTTLDWRTATIVVSGPANAYVTAELEHVGNDPTCVTCRLMGQIPASGELRLEGLYPGRYCISAFLPGAGTGGRDWSAIARRQWVTVNAGQTGYASVVFDAPPQGYWIVDVYTSGADTQAGIEIYGMTWSGYQVVGTTDASGRAMIPSDPPPANLLINDPYWGYQQVRGDGPTFEATLAGYYVLALSLGFGGEGGWWAFPGEGHEHLDGLIPGWKVKIVQTGQMFDTTSVPIGARTATPVPHLPAGTVGTWSFTPPEATYDIVLVDADGEYVTTLQQAAAVDRDGTDSSLLLLEVLGGKGWGDVAGHRPDRPTETTLPEAARIGLEHGTWQPVVLQRWLRSDTLPREAWLGLVCPYCLCMARVWPGAGYGYCPQCGADARTYMHGPPIGEGRWELRHLVLGPNQRKLDLLCDHWYRPIEYDEDDAFLALYQGLPRWVCHHPVLGEWDSGVWEAGTDAEELETIWCGPGERLLVRPKLQIVGQVAGDATYRLRYRTDDDQLLHVDFSLRRGDSGIKLLSSLAPVWAEVKDPAEVLFVRRITSVSLLDPAEDPGNWFYVVGDVPSLVLQRIRIERATASPFALQLGPLHPRAGPDLRRSPDGRVFVAFVRDGDVWVAQRPSPQRPWSVPVRVTHGGHFTDPSITILPSGSILVAYTDCGDGSQHISVSRDDGATWTALG